MRRYRRPWQDSEGHADCTRGSDRRGDVTDAARAGLRTLEGTSDEPLASQATPQELKSKRVLRLERRKLPKIQNCRDE
jgi:hypothetical protein